MFLPTFCDCFLLFGSHSKHGLPTKKVLNLAAIKTDDRRGGSGSEKKKREVTLCVVDESGNLLFWKKQTVHPSTRSICSEEARHPLLPRTFQRRGDAVKSGVLKRWRCRSFFRSRWIADHRGWQILGGIAASGAKSEIDEAIAQAGVDALVKK